MESALLLEVAFHLLFDFEVMVPLVSYIYKVVINVTDVIDAEVLFSLALFFGFYFLFESLDLLDVLLVSELELVEIGKDFVLFLLLSLAVKRVQALLKV